LKLGDEILSTDHAYGALERTWRFVCKKNGATLIRQPIPLPQTTPENFVETFWQGVTPRTRAIFIDHITSATALQFPIEPIIARAKEAGILTVIDGAHAPGQIPLNLTERGADMYIGAGHKWLCAPKGSAFLYARREIQPLLDPLVVSWGYEAPTYITGYPFVNYHEWQGTRDMSAFLATPTAIRFQAEHDWGKVRASCRELVVNTRARIIDLTGLPALCPNEPEWFTQFFAARLPDDVNVEKLKIDLYEKFHIEVPVHRWNDIPLIRVSFQGYNTQQDADALLHALEILL
jgi:isopenicillin-N epimerase